VVSRATLPVAGDDAQQQSRTEPAAVEGAFDPTTIAGVGRATADALVAAGYDEARLRAATPSELQDAGVSNRAITAIREWQGEGEQSP